MEDKVYYFFTPYVDTKLLGRCRLDRISKPMTPEEIADSLNTEGAVNIVESIMKSAIKSPEDEYEIDLSIGFLIDTSDPRKLSIDEININKEIGQVVIDDDKIGTHSYIVNFAEFILALSQRGFYIRRGNKYTYAPTLTSIVRDRGFEFAPELRVSLIPKYESLNYGMRKSLK